MKHPFAITLDSGSSLANLTGSWRTVRPVYVDRLPPCNHACPAGENIQDWLYHAEAGDYEKAWRVLTQDNPLPAVMGRVCYHPCESACNRAQVDEAVGINSVERFLGDEAIRRNWRFAPPEQETGKRVLVVGAGPSGLSAVYHLRRMGHAVAIHDAGPAAGGMMRFGIPKYRLPRDVLDAPKHGCLNVHASILPKYRGAAPITWAIVRGEKETGVDLMAMEEGLDTGGVYAEIYNPTTNTTANTTTVVLTLVAVTSSNPGDLLSSATAGAMTWTPTTSLKNTSQVVASTATATETGASDKDL